MKKLLLLKLLLLSLQEHTIQSLIDPYLVKCMNDLRELNASRNNIGKINIRILFQH
jgi:hypothetical protein